MVRTRDSHSLNRSSILRIATKQKIKKIPHSKEWGIFFISSYDLFVAIDDPYQKQHNSNYD